VAPDEEAAELVAAAAGDPDLLGTLVDRRCGGEPLAWVVGGVDFCGHRILVDPGVYVPRWQSEPLARRAAAHLPDRGVAVDAATGSGALAVHLARTRPGATVVATDLDPRAVACARANGVDARRGDLLDPVPDALRGRVDVVVAVVPYVPTGSLRLLPRDVLDHEPRTALDGGPAGIDVLIRLVATAPAVLRPGGRLLCELGGDQADHLAPELRRWGFGDTEVLVDDEGDVRGVVATLG
jgi:release factor glutamine methyltransferase